jgi:hypothetical protein
MPSIRRRSLPRHVIVALGLAIAAIACALAIGASAAGAADRSGGPPPAAPHDQRLVVRGDAHVEDAPCPGGVCIRLTDGAFRGTLGTGSYRGDLQLRVAETFPNGEGGVCAPLDGTIVLGAGTPDRLVLAIRGDSCQDGAGPVTSASFTGVARFRVVHGTGRFAGSRGRGLATFLEDAADHDRMTLVGRLKR